MSRVLNRGRWAAPLVLLLGLIAGSPAPAAAAPIPAGLTLTAAVTTTVEQVCYKEAAAYASKVHAMGYDATRAGIIAALMRPGVQNVILAEPAADLVAGIGEANFAESITVTIAGTDV